MRMAATFLFVKDNGARLIVQPEFVFNVSDSALKNVNWNALGFRRVEAKREKELLALGPPADGVSFVEGVL